jgi:phage repressor protein C with HTH and peptisase S24 domain
MQNPARQFAARLHQAMDLAGRPKRGRQGELVRLLKVAQPTAKAWLDGEHAPNKERTRVIAAHYHVSVEWLMFGRGSPTEDYGQLREASAEPYADDYVTVPIRDVRLAAGSGAQNDFDTVLGGLKFLRRSLSARGLSPATLQATFCKGDSMIPSLRSGDVLLVDTSQITPAHGRIFAVYGDDVGDLVKRVHRAPGGWHLVSDNNASGEHPPIPVPSDWQGFKITGRVVWTGGWLP